MSQKKDSNLMKFCIIASTTVLISIAIGIIPISKKARYWNSCIKNTVLWIDENKTDLDGWNQSAKQTLAVAVCNGAVYRNN